MTVSKKWLGCEKGENCSFISLTFVAGHAEMASLEVFSNYNTGVEAYLT